MKTPFKYFLKDGRSLSIACQERFFQSYRNKYSTMVNLIRSKGLTPDEAFIRLTKPTIKQVYLKNQNLERSNKSLKSYSLKDQQRIRNYSYKFRLILREAITLFDIFTIETKKHYERGII